MIRLGLCCIFKEQEIKFKTTTATYLDRLDDPYKKISDIIFHNVCQLRLAIQYCIDHDIGSFRITSRFFPLYTHPKYKYLLKDLDNHDAILKGLNRCRDLSGEYGLRLTFHPDQFVVLNSQRKDVVINSVAEVEYHAVMAEHLGADIINIHAGGVYGDKDAALCRLEAGLEMLSESALKRLTIENDDRSYTPEDLFGICCKKGVPLVYDVHHHRCLKDGWSEEKATSKSLETWNREPLFHISTPRSGWGESNQRSHNDFIDISDFPLFWGKIPNLTVEVEAKSKELAVLKLRRELSDKSIDLWYA